VRLDRANRDISAVLGRIAAVERGAAVDYVLRALACPRFLLAEGLERRHQMRDPVDHRDVNSLTPPGAARFDGSGEQADGQIERASSEIGDEIEWGRWRTVWVAEAVQSAG